MEHSPLPIQMLVSNRREFDWQFSKLTWRRMGTARRRLGFVVGAFAWPVWSLYEAGRLTYNRGSSSAAGRTHSALRQWYDQAVLAAYYGRPPHHYYRFGLHEHRDRRRALAYLSDQEFRSLVEIASDAATFELFGDKLEFERECVARGLSTLNTLRVVSSTECLSLDGTEDLELPPHDLFVKPRFGLGGKGVQLWRYESGSYVDDDTSRSLSAAELISCLQGEATHGDLLIQRRTLGNSAIHEFVGGRALATVRVLTVLDSARRAVPVFALLKVPGKDAIVDQLRYGGVVCPIDLDTGQLRPGFEAASHEPIATYSATGVEFSDLVLPLWSEVPRLAVEAHQQFNGVTFVGWDIAILEDRPALVEGNAFPGIGYVQQAYGPLLLNRHFRDACERLMEA